MERTSSAETICGAGSGRRWTSLFGILVTLAVSYSPVAFLSGCRSATLDPGESRFSAIGGDLVAVEEASLQDTRTAAMKALERLGLRPQCLERDAMTAVIVGEITVGVIPQNREIRVRLERMDDTRTRIAMRILFTREPKKLELVMREIRRELGIEPESKPKPKPKKESAT